MKRVLTVFFFVIVLGAFSPGAAQDLPRITAVWEQTLAALNRGDSRKAKELFADFNRKARAYVRANGRTWQIEYLIGSLNCQFPETRASGAGFLTDILQNSRALNSAGEQELKRQLAACTAAPAPIATPISDTHPDLPRDIADASAHFQSPGVHGDMKGGYNFKVENEAAVAISPIPAAELTARRVPLSKPQKALASALSRLPPGAAGGIVEEFAVTAQNSDQSRAIGIGKCLQTYSPPLKKQFEIEPSTYMVTIYTANSALEVYQYASRLHGLQLPQGVVAYSVPEDMSLAGVGYPNACGSMAHELVHLLIKNSFPLSPAWLEEGLASQVAVAAPESSRFKFSWSWRDDTLSENFGLRPRVGELLDAPWASFSAAGYLQMPQTAAIQAMAAVFIRYLDAKGKLSDVYFAVRNRHFSSDLSHYKSYREIVEETLGAHVDRIDADFAEWFQQQKLLRPQVHRTAEADREPNAASAPCEVPEMAANMSADVAAKMAAQQQQPDCQPRIMNQRAPDLPATAR